MSCGPNRTCHAACDCREAQWAAKLAAAEARHAEDDAKVRTLVSKALAAVRGQEAAEERAARLEEALGEIERCDSLDEPPSHKEFPLDHCPSCIARAALAPPPEAAAPAEPVRIPDGRLPAERMTLSSAAPWPEPPNFTFAPPPEAEKRGEG